MATIAEKTSFIGTCSSIIRENYDGNPLSLDSFIDKILLIQELTERALLPTFLTFIKSKLQGVAREALPETVTSIDEVISALRSRIKPDNSKVVAGRIAALQVRNGNYQDFAKQAEELSDALERSLVIEGMTKTKAKEMAIEQTINVCRLNARSDLVKSIIASSQFTNSKEVVAKLVVEQVTEAKEKQVLAFKTAYNSNRSNNYRFYRGNYRRNYYNQGSSRGNNSSRPNYQRGRNNYNRGNQNTRGYNNSYRYNSNPNNRVPSNNQTYSVRVAENSQTPQDIVYLGEQNQS